jgi:hypothetical protein
MKRRKSRINPLLRLFRYPAPKKDPHDNVMFYNGRRVYVSIHTDKHH